MSHTLTPGPTLERLQQLLRKQGRRLQVASASSPLTVDYVSADPDATRAERRLRAKRLLAETEAALDRLERGRYGICEACQRPMALVRLEILPHTRHCMRCQQDRDLRRLMPA